MTKIQNICIWFLSLKCYTHIFVETIVVVNSSLIKTLFLVAMHQILVKFLGALANKDSGLSLQF